MVFVLAVLEGSWEFAQSVHVSLVAFNRVPHGILWEVLWKYRVGGTLLMAVQLEQVHVGLWQGCPLSPVLVIIFITEFQGTVQGQRLMLSGQLQAKLSSLGGLEPPTFRLTAERANRLRHRDWPAEPLMGSAIDLQAQATTLGGKGRKLIMAF